MPPHDGPGRPTQAGYICRHCAQRREAEWQSQHDCGLIRSAAPPVHIYTTAKQAQGHLNRSTACRNSRAGLAVVRSVTLPSDQAAGGQAQRAPGAHRASSQHSGIAEEEEELPQRRHNVDDDEDDYAGEFSLNSCTNWHVFLCSVSISVRIRMLFYEFACTFVCAPQHSHANSSMAERIRIRIRIPIRTS